MVLVARLMACEALFPRGSMSVFGVDLWACAMVDWGETVRLLTEAAESEEFSERERALLKRAAAKLGARSIPIIEFREGAWLDVGAALGTADIRRRWRSGDII